MTPEIERLAKEAGGRAERWMTNPPKVAQYVFTPDQLAKFLHLAAEECAKECDLRSGSEDEALDTVAYGSTRGAEYCAAAIRQKFPAPKGEA